MKTIIINSYEELNNTIEEITSKKIIKENGQLRRYFFRGQQNKKWILESAATRNQKYGNNIPFNENKEIEKIKIKESYKSKMALAFTQHDGHNTRCLDFTRNPNVALYFACNPIDDKGFDGALYILEHDYHKPEWYTNYLSYYTATITDKDVISAYDLAKELSKKDEIIAEFKRTGRIIYDNSDVEFYIQPYLGKGIMIDYEGNDYGSKKIKNQEAALYHFGLRYFYINDKNQRKYVSEKYLVKYGSNANHFYIDLRKVQKYTLEKNQNCTKIIIPQKLKKEIYEKINIKPEDLGLK